MKKRYLLPILPTVAVILAALPSGVTMSWGKQLPDGTIGRTLTHCSFFTLMPAAYGDFAPLLTAWMSVLLLVVCLIAAIAGKGMRVVLWLTLAALTLATVHILTAICLLNYFPVVGLAMVCALGGEAGLTFMLMRKKTVEKPIE